MISTLPSNSVRCLITILAIRTAHSWKGMFQDALVSMTKPACAWTEKTADSALREGFGEDLLRVRRERGLGAAYAQYIEDGLRQRLSCSSILPVACVGNVEFAEVLRRGLVVASQAGRATMQGPAEDVEVVSKLRAKSCVASHFGAVLRKLPGKMAAGLVEGDCVETEVAEYFAASDRDEGDHESWGTVADKLEVASQALEVPECKASWKIALRGAVEHRPFCEVMPDDDPRQETFAAKLMSLIGSASVRDRLQELVLETFAAPMESVGNQRCLARLLSAKALPVALQQSCNALTTQLPDMQLETVSLPCDNINFIAKHCAAVLHFQPTTRGSPVWVLVELFAAAPALQAGVFCGVSSQPIHHKNLRNHSFLLHGLPDAKGNGVLNQDQADACPGAFWPYAEHSYDQRGPSMGDDMHGLLSWIDAYLKLFPTYDTLTTNCQKFATGVYNSAACKKTKEAQRGLADMASTWLPRLAALSSGSPAVAHSVKGKVKSFRDLWAASSSAED